MEEKGILKRGRGAATPEKSDGEILDLYWARDEQAIACTDAKYGKYLYTIAYNILHDRLDCEESVSDTYLGAWNRIPPARPTVFHVFLSRMTRNISVSRYRRNSAARRIPGELLISLEELEESAALVAAEEDTAAVERLSHVFNDLLREMTEREEFVFVCRYYYSDPVRRIAGMYRVSERTVQRDLERIRVRLRMLLEKEGIDV